MARSEHATYTAADRYERRATRRQRPAEPRRVRTRAAIVRAAILDGVPA